MNLADYLSELLGLHDEVSVPGLGYFVRMHVNAFYNDSEARFYPPYHQVKFVAQPKDDETFAQYVADKKNISLASSKYFVEKFTTKLKEDAARGKYLFADLGSFQTEADQLVFKPNDRIPADPAFYGYPLVHILKVGQPVSYDTKQPQFAQTVPAAAVTTAPPAAPVQAIPPPQYYEEEAEARRSTSPWLIVLIILAIAALAVFGVYKFYPEAFDKVKSEYYKITGKTEADIPAVKQPVKKDSEQRTPAVKDTTAKTAAAVALPDTAVQSRYELIAKSFRTMGYANSEIKRLKTFGLDATISTDAPGPFIKVSLGAFPTQNEADSIRNILIKTGKISSKSQIIKINPQ